MNIIKIYCIQKTKSIGCKPYYPERKIHTNKILTKQFLKTSFDMIRSLDEEKKQIYSNTAD